MSKTPEFSIVLPVMNQEDHIGQVIEDYYRRLTKNKFSFELIPVINGTIDNSFKICQKLAKKYNNVRVFELKKGGYGRGVIYGLKKARGKYLCYANSARVYSDELVASFKRFLHNDEVILHAVRIKRDIKLRKITSWIFKTTCQILTGVRSSDINGTPKIFNRNIYKKLKLNFLDSMVDLELLDKAKRIKIKIVEFPIYKNKRHGGKSTSNYLTTFRLIKEVIIYFFKNVTAQKI